MKKQTNVARLLVVSLSIVMILGAAISLIGWITGWGASIQYCNGLFIAGAVLIVLGTLSVVGTYGQRASFGVQYSQSSGDMNLHERTSRWVSDITQGFNALIIGYISGGSLILVSILVDRVFG